MSDPFEDIIREQAELDRTIERTRLKEIPIYDKGSFAPVLSGSGTPGSFTYGSRNLIRWTRIGGMLFFGGTVHITATAVAPVGTMSISTFPFAGIDPTTSTSGMCEVKWSGITLTANYTSISLQFTTTTSGTLIKSGTAGVALAVLTGAELTAAAQDFRIGGHYRIA